MAARVRAVMRLASLALLLLGACVVPDDLLDDRACPCGEGFFCGASQRCLPDGDTSEPPATPRTCWQPRVCDWSVPGTFTFDQDDGSIWQIDRVSNVSFSPDGCSLLHATQLNIFESMRPSATEPFGPAMRMTSISVPDSQHGKGSFGPFGLELFYSSALPEEGALVYRSTRSTLEEPFSPGVIVDNLNAPGLNTFDVFLAPHGRRIYFARGTASEDQDLLVAERPTLSAPFGPPRRLDELSMDVLSEAEPMVTADGLTMTYIATPGLGATRQVFYATRESWNDPWTPRGIVPGDFLAMGDEREGAISADGCELAIIRDPDVIRLVYRSLE